VGLRLRARLLPDVLRLNGLQARLLVAALAAAGAADLDLLTPGSYVPSAVAEAWSARLFEVVPDLVLVEGWDDGRAQLRPLTLRRLPVPVPIAARHRHGRHDPPLTEDGRPAPAVAAAVAGLPPLSEHTAVLQTPLGPLLQSAAVWTGTAGGFEVH